MHLVFHREHFTSDGRASQDGVRVGRFQSGGLSFMCMSRILHLHLWIIISKHQENREVCYKDGKLFLFLLTHKTSRAFHHYSVLCPPTAPTAWARIYIFRMLCCVLFQPENKE